MDQNCLLDNYEFNRLVFGVNLAQFISQTHAENNKIKAPRAAETILKSTYMDGSMDSVMNQDETQLNKDLIMLWKSPGIHPRKWISNSSEVMKEVPIDGRTSTVNLLEEHLPNVKTLGV